MDAFGLQTWVNCEKPEAAKEASVSSDPDTRHYTRYHMANSTAHLFGENYSRNSFPVIRMEEEGGGDGDNIKEWDINQEIEGISKEFGLLF